MQIPQLMSNFKLTDLQYEYRPDTAENYPNVVGFSDTYILDLHNNREVLAFINRYMIAKQYAQITTFRRIETFLKDKMPDDIKEYGAVKEWLDDHLFST